MAEIQNYQVNYTIDVKTNGVQDVTKFAEAINKLKISEKGAEAAITQVKNMVNKMDAIFKPKGRKRDVNYNVNVKTDLAEEKLDKVLKLIKDIQAEAAKINLVVNAGQKLDSQAIKAQAKAVLKNQELAAQEEAKKSSKKTASQAMEAMREPIKAIDKTIGKVNAALVSLETGREINIKTDVAKKKLEEILSLLGQIKGATNMTLGTNMVSPPAGSGSTAITPIISNTVDSDKASPHSSIQRKVSANENKTIKEAERELKRLARESEKEFKRQDREYINLWNKIEKEQEREYRDNIKKKLDNFRKLTKDMEEQQKRYEKYQEYVMANKLKMEARQEKENEAYLKKVQKEQEREYRANVKKKLDNFRRISKEMEESQKRYEKYQEYSMASQLKREAKQEKEARHRQRIAEREYYSRQKGAINRLQYSRLPSWGSMPFAGMFSAYAGYSVFKSELADAVEYANIMETARSILRVADSDLSTFEDRFEQMSKNVRQIGVDTKFTATEIAGATKFLAMAGMNIDTINKAMRPITNLALIGDADVAQIADLATNIMSGYDIRSSSMNTVADILASTIARSNVNVLEMAESFKMAAGYLRLSGVNFSEASAAVGILGNAGMKGTMAGTALRAMSGRFAKPTKEAQDTLDRLGVKFTEYRDIYGKQVEKLRPLADIFEDLNKSGATLGDMQAIFGKIGGNAAMMFIDNYEELRTLANQNKASNGISQELALTKQNTTKGLWAQMTSQFSESFMQAYESMEPQIRGALRDLLDRFKPQEFAKGLETIGKTLLDVFSILGKIGTWITKNLTWLEPLLITGFVTTKIFKFAGALTNLGVALGFIGRQKAATNILTSVAGTLGGGTMGRVAGMFASQVSSGGVVGAASSLSAIGTGAVAATAGLSALVGILGMVAYKTWQVNKARSTILEEVNSNKKYRYPSIDALTESLNKAYSAALATGEAVKDLTAEKTLGEKSGLGDVAFSGNWWKGIGTILSQGTTKNAAYGGYSIADAYQDAYKTMILAESDKKGQKIINSALADLAKQNTATGIQAFIDTAHEIYGVSPNVLDKSLYVEKNGKVWYTKDMSEQPYSAFERTPTYLDYINNKILPNIITVAEKYKDAIVTSSGAQDLVSGLTDINSGKTVSQQLEKIGWKRSMVDGTWYSPALPNNPTDKDRVAKQTRDRLAHQLLVATYTALTTTMGGQANMAYNIMTKAGFSPDMFSNEPDSNDKYSWDKRDISYLGNKEDDGGAGGNYSGTGKLSSAAPKQVVVNITNLLSIQTVELMKTPEGKTPEMQDLKEMMAQALIDVVHDFDASWNG